METLLRCWVSSSMPRRVRNSQKLPLGDGLVEQRTGQGRKCCWVVSIDSPSAELWYPMQTMCKKGWPPSYQRRSLYHTRLTRPFSPRVTAHPLRAIFVSLLVGWAPPPLPIVFSQWFTLSINAMICKAFAYSRKKWCTLLYNLPWDHRPDNSTMMQ